MKVYEVYVDILDNNNEEVIDVKNLVSVASSAEAAHEEVHKRMSDNGNKNFYVWEVLESDVLESVAV